MSPRLLQRYVWMRTWIDNDLERCSSELSPRMSAHDLYYLSLHRTLPKQHQSRIVMRLVQTSTPMLNVTFLTVKLFFWVWYFLSKVRKVCVLVRPLVVNKCSPLSETVNSAAVAPDSGGEMKLLPVSYFLVSSVQSLSAPLCVVPNLLRHHHTITLLRQNLVRTLRGIWTVRVWIYICQQ